MLPGTLRFDRGRTLPVWENIGNLVGDGFFSSQSCLDWLETDMKPTCVHVFEGVVGAPTLQTMLQTGFLPSLSRSLFDATINSTSFQPPDTDQLR